jgi:glycosyltransferase involved in cell wall biosynthesis
MSLKKRKLKVSLIGTNGLPAKYGGFETLTEYIAINLNKDYDLYCYCSKTSKSKRLKNIYNTNLIYIPLKANGFQSMLYDFISILHSLFSFDVLIILGFSGVFAFPLKYIFNKKIIFNIGGIEWQKVRGSKQLAKIEILIKKIFERICIQCSDTIIVDNQVLYDYVKNKYNVYPILAEYGGDHAVIENKSITQSKIYPFLNNDYDLTISRAQEDMNIHMVINAYIEVPKRKIVIISNWNTSKYGCDLKNKYFNKYDNILLLDAIYDLKLLNMIRSNCSIYIHTHSLCGTAPSLTEAMSLGKPVICFDVPTNRATTEEKSYYFSNIDDLINIINELNISQILRLSDDMSEIAKRRYTWSRIINIYKNCIDLYE